MRLDCPTDLTRASGATRFAKLRYAAVLLALMIAVACSEGVSSTGATDPSTSAQPGEHALAVDAVQNATPSDLLATGMAQARAGDYQAALKSLQERVDREPSDARAWVELGWAAFKANDLQRATSATAQAISITTDNSLRGAAMYNAGRIAEAAGERRKAIDYYVESLKVRDNHTVLERLAELSYDAAARLVQERPEIAARDRWLRLFPITFAGANDPYSWAYAFEETNGSEELEGTSLKPSDPQIPKALRKRQLPFRVTANGIIGPEKARSIEIWSTPMGSYWAWLFAPIEARGAMLATRTRPHDQAKIVIAPEVHEATSNEPVLKAVRAFLSPELRESLDSVLTRKAAGWVRANEMSARLPKGATRVASVFWLPQGSDTALGGVYALDDRHRVVHCVSEPDDWAELTYIVDLDGDGFDEIGWNSGGIESSSSQLTHLTDETRQTLTLASSGH